MTLESAETKAAKTHAPTWQFLTWLREKAASGRGKLPEFSNAEASVAMGLTVRKKTGRFQGNVQSRVDFACYLCGFPPIGLVADEAFDRAWNDGKTGWEFPVRHMARGAKQRTWLPEDFALLESTLRTLRPGATKLWDDEIASSLDKIKIWAYSVGLPEVSNTPTVVTRNPAWSRDELILALHLYLHHRPSVPGKSSTEVAELSRLLNRIPSASSRTGTYRNSASVYMQLMNFQEIDPITLAKGNVGLARGNKDEKVVWELFADDLPRLDAVFAALREAINADTKATGAWEDDETEIEDCEEGRIFTRLHRFRERNRKLVADFKAYCRKRDGCLICAGCDLDFVRKYGAMADRLIDVHHTKPVHTMKIGDKTSPKDLALLCVSCHRAVHSRKRWLEVSELRLALISKT